MKLPIIDKAYVPDSDVHAACGDGFPKGCRIPNAETSSKAKKTVHYHKASLPGKIDFISLRKKLEYQERDATCKRWIQRLDRSLLVYLACW